MSRVGSRRVIGGHLMWGWVLLIGGGIMSVVPGMFQVINGATLLGLVLALTGATMLITREAK